MAWGAYGTTWRDPCSRHGCYSGGPLGASYSVPASGRPSSGASDQRGPDASPPPGGDGAFGSLSALCSPLQTGAELLSPNRGRLAHRRSAAAAPVARTAFL